MRGTLHLFGVEEYPSFLAALGTQEGWRRPAWLRTVGLTVADMERLIGAIEAALAGRSLTRQELADEVGADAGPALREQLLSGWGSLLKPAAYLGALCSGPSRGQRATFVRPVDWLGHLERIGPEQGWRRICRAFLRTYGPASQADLVRWWGVRRRSSDERSCRSGTS
jgi:hypothetical protein